METTDIEMMAELIAAYQNIKLSDIGGETVEGGGFPAYADEIGAFFQLAAQDYWVDLEYMPAAEEKNVENDGYVQQANLDQLKSMLTYCLRAERFAAGSWQALIKNGVLGKIIERLIQIKQENS